jgi:hypothetical protein
MYIKRLNNNGVTIVAGLLLLVIVAVIGATGYYVYKTNKNTKVAVDTTQSNSQSTGSVNKPQVYTMTFPEWGVKLVTSNKAKFDAIVRVGNEQLNNGFYSSNTDGSNGNILVYKSTQGNTVFISKDLIAYGMTLKTSFEKTTFSDCVGGGSLGDGLKSATAADVEYDLNLSGLNIGNSKVGNSPWASDFKNQGRKVGNRYFAYFQGQQTCVGGTTAAESELGTAVQSNYRTNSKDIINYIIQNLQPL